MEHILFFFDVPIYRLPPETYYAEREHHVQAQMYGGNAQNVALLKGFDERNSSIGGFFREHLEKSYGGPWDFNEIVGYIRLHFVGSQVRGELWMVSGTRIVRTRRKLFLWQSHKVVPEMDVPYTASNEEVYRSLVSYLEAARKELKGRFIDTSTFERLGKYVDWRALRQGRRGRKTLNGECSVL